MIYDTQPELTLFRQVTETERSAFEAYLQRHTAWITSTGYLEAAGLPVTESNKRKLRQIASSSEWIISGQPGYRHLEHASAEEISHAANWLESQAKQMGERAQAIRRNAHKRIGV